MKRFATDQEMLLKNNIFPFTSPRQIPLSFRYGDRMVQGLPDDFSVAVSERKVEEQILLHTVDAQDANGLSIRVECTEYLDFPATEWVAYFTNIGNAPTAVISDICIGGVLTLPVYELHHSNGETRDYHAYKLLTTSLTDTCVFSPNDGTSCRGAFPYMRLTGEGLGVNLAFGWSGKWAAELSPVPEGVRICLRQARCRMRILPGETMQSPRLTCLAYLGDESRGRNMWRRWFFRHITPPIKPLCCMHYYKEGGLREFTGSTEQGQIEAIDTYVRRGIRPDVLWLDAGWYPSPPNHWRYLGDWYPDPERYPNGLAPLGKKCAENDISLLLWFEPERAYAGKQLPEAHPEWMLQMKSGDIPDPFLLVNLGDPDCLDHIIRLFDGIIKESGTKIYRQDFNLDPYPRWIQNETEDRIGALENLHIQGVYRLWDELQKRNPGLIVDNCSSGGRRIDLEAMRHSIAFHYTDRGYGNHPTKQLQHRLMFEWVPYFRAHVQSWDDYETGEYPYPSGPVTYPAELDKYAFYVALTPAITDMLDHRDSDSRFALSKKMQPIWRKAAQLMLSCDYYPLTICRQSREDFYAMAFYSPENGNGFLNVVSNNNNPETRFVAKLDMLKPECSYILTEAESGVSRQFTGAQLAAGLPVDLPKRSGVLYFIQSSETNS